MADTKKTEEPPKKKPTMEELWDSDSDDDGSDADAMSEDENEPVQGDDKKKKKKSKKEKKSKKNKKKKKKKDGDDTAGASLFDEEAEVSDDASDNGSDDEEDEAKDNNKEDDYEKDGFVVDDEEAEEESDSDSDSDSDDDDDSTGGGKSKTTRRLKRKMDSDSELDEDDLSLVRETMERKKQRKDPSAEGGEDEGPDPSKGESDEDEDDGDSSSGDDMSESGESLDGFIVDNVDETDPDRKKRKKKKKKRTKKKRRNRLDGISSEQAMQFNDLFGFDPGEFETNLGGDDHEVEYGENQLQEERERRKEMESLLHGRYEPDVLKGIYFTDVDDMMRRQDVPERLQIRTMKLVGKAKFLSEESLVVVDPTDEEMMRAQTRWVIVQLKGLFQEYRDLGVMKEVYDAKQYAKLFTDETTLAHYVQQALVYFQRDLLEVPFVHFYRAEMVGSLSVYHLWNVYELGLKYQLFLARVQAMKRFVNQHVPHEIPGDGGDGDAAPSKPSETASAQPPSEEGGVAEGTADAATTRVSSLSITDETEAGVETKDGDDKQGAAAGDDTKAATGDDDTKSATGGNNDEKVGGDEKSVETKTDESADMPEDVPPSESKSDTTAPSESTKPQDPPAPVEVSRRIGGEQVIVRTKKKPVVTSERTKILGMIDRIAMVDCCDETCLQEFQQYLKLKYGSRASSSAAATGGDEDDHGDSKVVPIRPTQNKGASKAHAGVDTSSTLCTLIGRAVDLGSNVEAGGQIMPVGLKDGDTNPEVEAMEMLGPSLGSENAVIAAAEDAIAREIALDYRILARVRKMFREYGKLNTTPTIKGRKYVASDPAHEYYRVITLANKPFGAFIHPPNHEYGAPPPSPDEDHRDQILYILKARDEGFLDVDANTEELEGRLMSVLTSCFIRPQNIPYAREDTAGALPPWDRIRYNVLRRTVRGYLVPWARVQMVAELRETANRFVATQCAKSLYEMVTVAPFRLPVNNAENLLEVPPEKIHVMGVVMTNDRDDSGYAVALDTVGAVIDHRKLPRIQHRNEWTQILEAFVEEYAPHLVVLGSGVGLRVRSVKIHLERMCSRKVAEWRDRKQNQMGGDSDDEDEDSCPYFYTVVLDEQVAHTFAVSEDAQKELPDYDVNLRKAVSLGRHMQNPLLEVARLWTDVSKGIPRPKDSNILTLSMHRSQRLVSANQLLVELERVFINTTAFTGVDLNHAVRNPHAAGSLQFVAGLGPRKAMMLLSNLRREGGWVHNREDMHEKLGSTGKSSSGASECVFRNCAGFLRCFNRSPEDVDEFRDRDFGLLDSTLVHPESYQVAAMLCWMSRHGTDSDKQPPVFTYEDGKINPQFERCVRAVMESAAKVLNDGTPERKDWLQHWMMEVFGNYFVVGDGHVSFHDHVRHGGFQLAGDLVSEKLSDIQSFVDSIEQYDTAKKTMEVLWCIDQLRFSRTEKRMPYAPPNETVFFEMLTGNSSESLREDMVVTVRISSIDKRWVQADLDGLRCSIHVNDLSDERVEIHDEQGLLDYVQKNLGWKAGDPVRARVKSIQRGRFLVNLTTRPSQVSNWAPRITDPFWVSPANLARDDQRRGAQTGAGAQKKFKARTIKHPNFQNVDRAEAERLLAEMEIGDVIFRPNSKGFMAISASFKCGATPLWIQHIAVEEKNKKPTNPGLASTLKVKNDTFEDLDELMARYFSPIGEFLRDLYEHKSYRAGDRQYLENSLREEKRSNPKRIPYCVGRHEKPDAVGYFRLCYLPGANTVASEIVSVTPDGFKIGTKVHTSMDRMIGWFKANYKELANRHRSSHHQQHRGGSGGYHHQSQGRSNHGGGGGYHQSSAPRYSGGYDDYGRGGGDRRYDDDRGGYGSRYDDRGGYGRRY